MCHTLLFVASSFRPSLQGKTRESDVGCVQSQSSNRQRTTLLAPRPLATACLCEALVRQARGSLVFYAVLLKTNTAGLATALRGDSRPCQTPAAAAERQQAQLDVVRQMPFLRVGTWAFFNASIVPKQLWDVIIPALASPKHQRRASEKLPWPRDTGGAQVA